LSLCSLVPREGKEPGLLVVLPEGEIRLWESLASSIGMSSSNDETSSYQRLALPLGVGEGIAALTRCEVSFPQSCRFPFLSVHPSQPPSFFLPSTSQNVTL